MIMLGMKSIMLLLLLDMMTISMIINFYFRDCDKAFPSSTRLKRHSIIHTSLKPFKCNICDKSFNRKSSLRVHIKIHSGVKSYVCSVCNKGFMWAHSLRAHIAIHNKDKKGVKKKTDKKTKSKKGKIIYYCYGFLVFPLEAKSVE